MPPEFSIIVPTFRRPAQLARLLHSLTRLRYPAAHREVIVVDDGGGDCETDRVLSYTSQLKITVLRHERTGPAGARNFGAAHACGEFLAFVDDDCEPDPGWLDAMAAAFRNGKDFVCGGRTINSLKHNLYSEATQLLVDHLYARYSPKDYLGGFFAANNMALSREAFLAAGGFGAGLRFGEDREFCHRWACLGGNFAFVPEAVVYHGHPLSFRSFLTLHVRYGAGSGEFRVRCSKNGGKMPRVNSPAWYAGLIASGIRRERNMRGLRLSLLLCASQIAALAGMLFRHAVLRHARESN